jgi:adenine phosphoribosyltransferase
MRLQDTIREVPDFPKKGILFYDITTLAKNPPAFHQAIDQLAEHYRDRPVDVVVSV